MDEFTADTIVNREEPIPVIAVSGNDGASSDPEGKRKKLENIASSKIRDKLHCASRNQNDFRSSLQDRLFTK